jgi:uncharacterized protein YigA (DUF484 family)
MTANSNAKEQPPLLDEQQVAEYLEANPDFFSRFPATLDQLELSHGEGEAASLIERQVHHLRDENHKIQQRMLRLVAVARDNDRLAERMQRLTLALLQAADLKDLFVILQEVVCDSFEADAIAVRMLADEPGLIAGVGSYITRDEPGLDAFTHIISGRKPLCGRLTRDQLGFLFGDGAEKIESAVLVPIGEAELLGLLAIGSHEATRFQHDMGTVFLSHLGELLAAMIHRHSA